MKITKSLIISLLPFLFILVAIGIGFFYLKPLYKEIDSLRSQVADKREIVSLKQRSIEKVKELKANYNLIEEKKKKKVFYILPTAPEIPNLLVQLEALASENGMMFEDVTFTESELKNTTKRRSKEKESEKKGGLKELTVDIKLNGRYEAFRNYLKALEQNIRIIDIVSIDFSSSKENGKESSETFGVFSYSIKMKAYQQ